VIIRSTWSSRLSYLTSQTSRVGGELQEVSERIASGIAVSKPSDAPELTSRIMSIDREISDQARYVEDAGYATNLHDMAGTILMDLSTVVSEARALAVQMGSDTYDGPIRIASADQADQLLEQAINLLNTQVADRNLFSGQAYDTQAFADDLTYQGSQDASLIRVADGVEVTVGFNGDEMDLGSVLESIQGLREALLSDDSAAVRSSLDGLTAATEIVSKAQTTVGIEQMAALDFASFSQSMGVELEIQISSLRDDDSLKSLVRLGELQTQFEASIAMTAKSQLGNLFSRI
jgi:flagellin-like hook-associated protein FlgL